MTAELKNYLKRFLNPVFAFPAALYFIKALLKKVLRTIVPVLNTASMNKEIQEARRAILASGRKSLFIYEPDFDKTYEIKLVIGKMQIHSSKDWHYRFQDAEMNVSIDRWGWLLTGVSDEHLPLNPEDGILLIRSWCSQFINDEDLTKDAYSTGERISNAVIFFTLHNVEVPKDINLIIAKLAYQVAENIEYLPSGLTGNHAFNNARALYFAGYLNSSSSFNKMAISVARERLPALVTNDGFMREGSSHYHFLFTRWVVEIVWIARTANDQEALELFIPYAEKLLQKCWFFLIQDTKDLSWSIPLIGDVSPDCPPKWLIALPWSRIALSIYRPKFLPVAPENLGWAELFGGIEIADFHKVQNNTVFSSTCGWHRIEGFGWTIITYSPDKNGYMEATHSHQDLGSFTAYYNGMPIIIDAGRLDYTNSPTSKYGKSANSHNTVMVDGIEPVAEVLGWMLPTYGKMSSGLRVENNSDNVRILLKHNGFKRIALNKISHERSIILTSNSIEIIDNIHGSGHHSLELFFQFMSGISFEKLSSNKWQDAKKRITFDADLNSKTMYFAGEEDSDYGWIFPSYGVKESAISIKIDNLVDLPAQLSNKITIENF